MDRARERQHDCYRSSGIATGRRKLVKEIAPNDVVGVFGAPDVQSTSDYRSHAYDYGRTLSELYIVDGLR